MLSLTRSLALNVHHKFIGQAVSRIVGWIHPCSSCLKVGCHDMIWGSDHASTLMTWSKLCGSLWRCGRQKWRTQLLNVGDALYFVTTILLHQWNSFRIFFSKEFVWTAQRNWFHWMCCTSSVIDHHSKFDAFPNLGGSSAAIELDFEIPNFKCLTAKWEYNGIHVTSKKHQM